MNETIGSTPDLRAVLQQALALVERRRYLQAQTAIAHGLTHYPDDSELQYLAAFIEHTQGNDDAAMQGVLQVLARNPEHYGARRLCALLHEERGDLARAEEILIGLLREFPEDADLYGAYAEPMLRTLNFDKAGRLAAEGLRHAPEHGGCLYVAALMDIIDGRARGGQSENVQRLLQEHPEQVRSLLTVVVALIDQGRNRDALRIARELLRSEPDNEHILKLVRRLRVQNHWSMIPLYPMQRWGWTGAAVVTVGGIMGLRVAGKVLSPEVRAVVTAVWLFYCIYSWVWPSVFPKLVERWER